MTVPVRDAATVMLVRDGDGGLEVFMLQRNLRSVFVAGAHLFPGGAVDDADRHTDLEALCEGRTDAEASQLLGIERGGLAFWVAAIRECFEEAGVLLAYDGSGSGAVVRFDDPVVAGRFERHRADVDAGRRRLVDVCRDEGLRLAVDGMAYLSHWITPVGAPRRYDTRFFVAAAPPGQTPLHDDRETIANCWVRPADGLARFEAGEWDLIAPTEATLRTLARFDGAAELLSAVAHADPTAVVVERDGGVRLALPFDVTEATG